MRPERTFWEKATAVHVFCQQGEFRGGERFSRHWHDLVRLDHAGVAGSVGRRVEGSRLIAAVLLLVFDSVRAAWRLLAAVGPVAGCSGYAALLEHGSAVD